jgi:hypothetical protein
MHEASINVRMTVESEGAARPEAKDAIRINSITPHLGKTDSRAQEVRWWQCISQR